MSSEAEFLLKHGYVVLFAAVLTEQIGLPIPSGPLLLAAGALASLDRLNVPTILALSVLACLLSDTAWFFLGQRRGAAILGKLCRISLEPDSCVSRMHSVYARYGPKSLLFSKFVPGLGALGPTMAGLMELKEWKFIVLDAAGSLAWSGAYVLVGWMFRTQVEDLAASLPRFGAWLGGILGTALAIYLTVKYVRRRRLYHKLRMDRITPVELRRRMDASEKLTIVDLRNPIEWRDGRIPGAVQSTADKLHSLIPALAQTEVVIYCSCPNEAGSARAALSLMRQGVSVRPLEGGFARWQRLGFPVDNVVAPESVKQAVP